MDAPVRVLHVEDDPDLADLTAEFLEREDDRIEVSPARDAAQGLARLEGATIDCIVSDYDMPGRSGIEFLQAVRQEWPDLPFILFTGKGSEEVASEAISAGVTDYLQKATGTEQYELLANRVLTAVEQARTARELERQNDLFAKAQTIGNVGAWEYNLDGGDSYVSNEVLQIHGLDDDAELTPEGSLEFYHPEDREVLREALDAARNEGEPYDLELRLIDATGTQRWVRVRGEPQSDEEGTIVRIRGILQDITEPKRRENRLERQNERLEEFAQVVSHDIRNPLQVASGQLSVAEETGDPAAFRKSREAIERISAIVENILTLARHGRTVDDPETISLKRLVTRTWDGMETGGLELQFEGDCDIEADADRLRQLLENLFRNAQEHGSHDESASVTTVRVGPIEPMFTATRAVDEPNRGFYVADDGPGIDADIREDVFESGFTTATDGTGFGLAIVAQIAEAHGWDVSVSESRGGGARFDFRAQGSPSLHDSA